MSSTTMTGPPPQDHPARPAPPAGPARPTRPGRPARLLACFGLMLALLFGASYGLGRVVGPVAPGLAPAGTDRHDPGGRPGDDGHGGGDQGDGDGMSGMTMGAPAPSAVAVTVPVAPPAAETVADTAAVAR
ncbi:hypothetical protein [Kitasatospora sp. NPDC088346]|uniref:hypothetical protein n=1 Tax=Kitasatospora sp. NPDC088346 TaxID=3364073 RepID=UPI0037FD1878